MAVDRATVNVSASLLPDNIKVTVGGTTIYDMSDDPDTGSNNNHWVHYRGITDGATARDLVIINDIQYMNQSIDYDDTAVEMNETNDDVRFILIKNSGYTGSRYQESSTGTVSTSDLYVGLSGGDLAANSGTIIIGPNECWFAKLRGEQMEDINCASSSGNLLYDVFAILDVGGVA